MTTITESELIAACRTLFGKEVDISRDFLYYMQPSGVKSAYRKRAMENHPDLFAADPISIQQQQTALFCEIMHAYDVLQLFFKQRQIGVCSPPPGSGCAAPVCPPQRDTAWRPSSKATPSAASREDDTYFTGSVPLRTLRIGRYLYYRGKISFAMLLDALLWQRKQRPSFGEIALRWGLLDLDGVGRIVRAYDRPGLFGEKAVALKLLTVMQVNMILLYQRSHQDRLGEYFVRNKLLSLEEMEGYARELKGHNARVLAHVSGPRASVGVHA